MIHKEGQRIFAFSFIFFCAIAVASILLLNDRLWLSIPLAIICLLIVLFIARFFRVPDKNIQHLENIIYAPAYGKIVVIEKTFEDEFLKEERIQLSIFMSVWDVHINFFPFPGKVIYSKHHNGKYLIARNPKSSTLNERATVVIENKNNVHILLRQIAGIVARRIVCYANQGMTFKSGDEMGFIKFGSRVDIFLPLNTEILVNLGDHVKGSITPIAKF